MLAKVHILVPFEMTLPLGAEYKVYGYEKDGYQIYFDIPTLSGKPKLPDAPEEVLINGMPSVQADVITLTFKKDHFERGLDSPVDPPALLIDSALNSFLARLKYVSKAPQVKPIEFANSQWHLSYLNDDGTELEKVDGLVRGRGTRSFSFTFLGCDPLLWDHIFNLPEGFIPPPWSLLLIDARGALPHVGTALVLAATALEILIAELLDQLASKTAIPSDLWDWVNDRGHWQKEPSVEEQYDQLLKIMTGHSLKEDGALWEGLKNLRSARNSFVHEGKAKIGGKEVSVSEVLTLIGRAEAIVVKIREWLPEDCRWPLINHTIQIQMSKIISTSNTPSHTLEPKETE